MRSLKVSIDPLRDADDPLPDDRALTVAYVLVAAVEQQPFQRGPRVVNEVECVDRRHIGDVAAVPAVEEGVDQHVDDVEIRSARLKANVNVRSAPLPEKGIGGRPDGVLADAGAA